MKDAMPQWRTFSSSAPAGPGPQDHDSPRDAGAQRRPDRVVVVLGVLAAAAAGLAFMALGFAVLAGGSEPSLADLVGEPLDGLPPVAPDDAASASVEGAMAPGIVVVDVAGAVVRPGLHRLAAGARVGDAIEAAGGYAPRVDLGEASRSLNLALPLEDGTKVLVPELGVDRSTSRPADDGRIDLNRAGTAELESLPGIGPVTARKIIESREGRSFGSVRELRSRGVVGQSVFDDIKGLVSVSS